VLELLSDRADSPPVIFSGNDVPAVADCSATRGMPSGGDLFAESRAGLMARGRDWDGDGDGDGHGTGLRLQGSASGQWPSKKLLMNWQELDAVANGGLGVEGLRLSAEQLGQLMADTDDSADKL
jgi:hypothetical protein